MAGPTRVGWTFVVLTVLLVSAYLLNVVPNVVAVQWSGSLTGHGRLSWMQATVGPEINATGHAPMGVRSPW